MACCSASPAKATPSGSVSALDDLVHLGPEETGPWLEHVRGRASWEAEYGSRTGIAFRSDLHSVSVDFPPPFEKPVGTPRRLDVVLTPGETEWLIDASYGPDAKAVFEVVETNGEWALARGEVTLGGAQPALPAASHVEVTGEVAELDLDPWLALGAAGAPEPAGWLSRIGAFSLAMTGARVLDRRTALSRLELTPAADGSEFRLRLAGEGIAGEIAFPSAPTAGRARIRLERMHFSDPFALGEDGDSKPPGGGADKDPGPDRWPSFDARISSLRFDRLDLGVVQVTGERTENGLEIKKFAVDSSDLRIHGRGSWISGEDGMPSSRLEATLKTGNLSRLLFAAGLDEEAAAGGTVEVRFDLGWPGSLFEPSLPALGGQIEMDAEDGHLPRVRVGPIGRLFALVSLEALPRVLALDLSHVVGEGFAYNRITARTNLEDGKARIREFTITGPTARIEVRGDVDLAASRYDQEIVVTPRVTRSGALLPVWAAAWPVLIANFVLEKATGDEIILDRLFRLRYRLRGPLDDPGDRAHPGRQPRATEVSPSVLPVAPGERVVVGLSGGVDSAVTAAVLRDAGAAVEPVFMKNWEEDDVDGECSAADDLAEAEAVCSHLGLHLRTVNFSTEYWDRVFEPFLSASAAGHTPNPDVWCNQEIKFGELFRYADDLGIDRVATGHYARVAEREGRFRLLKGRDRTKDQSYFLYRIGQEPLARTLFPLGGRTKSEIRAMAEATALPNHARPDSTGICFIGERPFREFLARWIPPAPGPIETVDGERIGTHGGLAFHTLGQRRGLGIGGRRGEVASRGTSPARTSSATP